MTIAELLATLRQRDVRLWVDDGRLRCSAPASALDAELRAALATRKDEIIAWLRVASALNSGPPAIVPLKPEGRRPPLFAIPGHNGDVFCYIALAGHLDADQPLFGVQPPGLDGTEPLERLEELARYELEQIRLYRPHGPYLLAGYCAGGTLAYEIARQLSERGEHVALLALFGSPFPTLYRWPSRTRFRIEDLARRGIRQLRLLAASPASERLAHVRTTLARRARQAAAAKRLDNPVLESGRRVARTTIAAIRGYRPRRYPGRVDLFLPAEGWRRLHPWQWRAVSGTYRESTGRDGSSLEVMLQEPFVGEVARTLRCYLDEIARAESGRG